MSAVSTPKTTLKPDGTKNGVSVSKTSATTEYEKSLQIVLGTVFGVFGFLGILIIGTLIYRFCKNRNRERNQGSDRNPSLHRSVSIDLEQKQVPTVLMLYSFDCCAHEKVVEALAGFLIETCNCNVHIDMFEEQQIHERGLDEWLVDNLQEAEFIIVISSIGARLRCSKKKVRFKLEPGKVLPDYFAVAVDYVAEKMRVERSKGMPLTTFCVAYMDYSTESDIPPQLEMAYKFNLMKDVMALFCHIHGINGEPTKDGAPLVGLTQDSYDTSEMGQELKVAINSAKEYYRANPDWVEDRIEPIPNPSKKSRHVRKSSLEPLLLSSQHDGLPPDNHGITNDMTIQPLPKLPTDHHNITYISAQNRQNSFPSSLSSHQTLSTPPVNHSSKSCDSVPQSTVGVCELCGVSGHMIGSSMCKLKQILPVRENEQDENVKMKSKSMPAVNRNSLFSSQTVLHAEVHKEWDDNDGHFSEADSHETCSNHDSIIDDLQRDLDSIVNPCRVPEVHYSFSSYDKLASVNAKLTFPTKMENISEVLNKKSQLTDSCILAGDSNNSLTKEFKSQDIIELDEIKL
ncbi:interleukin-17 receptor [Mactra antiquata]